MVPASRVALLDRTEGLTLEELHYQDALAAEILVQSRQEDLVRALPLDLHGMQCGEVHGFVKRALVHRAFAEETSRQRLASAHLVGQRQPRGQRQAATDDSLPAIETGGAVEQVHGATTPARTTLLFAKHLGHDDAHGHAAKQRVAAFPPAEP